MPLKYPLKSITLKCGFCYEDMVLTTLRRFYCSRRCYEKGSRFAKRLYGFLRDETVPSEYKVWENVFKVRRIKPPCIQVCRELIKELRRAGMSYTEIRYMLPHHKPWDVEDICTNQV